MSAGQKRTSLMWWIWLIRHQADPSNTPKGQAAALFHQGDNNDYNCSSYLLFDGECLSCTALGGTICIISWEVTVKCPEEGIPISNLTLTKALCKLVTALSSSDLWVTSHLSPFYVWGMGLRWVTDFSTTTRFARIDAEIWTNLSGLKSCFPGTTLEDIQAGR